MGDWCEVLVSGVNGRRLWALLTLYMSGNLDISVKNSIKSAPLLL